MSRYAFSCLLCLFSLVGLAQAAAPSVPSVQTSGSHPAERSRPAVLARVNGQPIIQSRFDVALKLAIAQGGVDSPALRQTLKSQLVVQELLRQEAIRQKLQNDPAVIAAREEAGNRAMIERYVATAVKPEPVGETDVRARYDAIVGSLGKQEYKLGLIAVADGREAADLIDRLKRNEAGFADLAREHSKLGSRSSGGAIDWVSFPTPATEGHTAGLPLAVARVATALSPGALAAEPVAAEGLQWIVRLEAARPTRIPDYADVAPTLRRALEAQALERASAALVQRLLGAARIE